MNTYAGLTQQQALDRLKTDGPNQLPQKSKRPVWLSLWTQLTHPLILVLLFTGCISAWIGSTVDSLVIFAVVFINAIFGVIQEQGAESSIDSLRRLMTQHCVVWRDGAKQHIDASQLVCGDRIWVEAGMHVPADALILDATRLKVNESLLTGESETVAKQAANLSIHTLDPDSIHQLYAGTTVTEGHAWCRVTATSENTEVGKTGLWIEQNKPEVSALEAQSTALTQQLLWSIAGVSVCVIAVGIWRDMSTAALMMAVATLAIAAIPEGLPAIITMMLARAANRLAHEGAIVRRLSAIEDVGSVDVICLDKTGTLTQNCMQIAEIKLLNYTLTLRDTHDGTTPQVSSRNGFEGEQGADFWMLLRAGILCNNAHLEHTTQQHCRVVGDPTEGALLMLADRMGVEINEYIKEEIRLDTLPFTSEIHMMATLNVDETGAMHIWIKGSPEQILSMCDHAWSHASLNKQPWNEWVAECSAQGYRVLALAVKPTILDALPHHLHAQTDFGLIGMVALSDPLRDNVQDTLSQCQQAGIAVKMLTGDHPHTTQAIARQLHIPHHSVITGEMLDSMTDEQVAKSAEKNSLMSRLKPHHKHRLVRVLQSLGHRVAMVGDGVNDGPALKAAHVGVAMGLGGTDVARDASDMVLSDNRLDTLVKAIRQGRIFNDNLRMVLRFMLPTNVAEAMVVAIAILLGWPAPISTTQILWINLVTSVTLTLAFVFEPPHLLVMQQPSQARPTSWLNRVDGFWIAGVSVLQTTCVFLIFDWALQSGYTLAESRTAALNLLVMSEMGFMFNVRSSFAPSNRVTPSMHKMGWLALATLAILQLLLTYWPHAQELMATSPIDLSLWLALAGITLLQFLIIEAVRSGVCAEVTPPRATS